MAYRGVSQIRRAFKIIKEVGGFRGALFKLFRFDGLKTGRLVGIDKYGNRYYYNQLYSSGQSRWIEYADYLSLDYDATHIPPKWYSWLHFKTDLTPCMDRYRISYKWMLDHSSNLSGTSDAFMPYPTTKPKIEAWIPNNCTETHEI